MGRKEQGLRGWEGLTRATLLQEEIVTFGYNGDNPHPVTTPRVKGLD